MNSIIEAQQEYWRFNEESCIEFRRNVNGGPIWIYAPIEKARPLPETSLLPGLGYLMHDIDKITRDYYHKWINMGCPKFEIINNGPVIDSLNYTVKWL